jgi:ERCC4-related helicase
MKDQHQQDDLNKAAEIKRLTEQHGTKMAHLIFYLRYLFKENPNSRVIIFSQVNIVLVLLVCCVPRVQFILLEGGIENKII